MALEDEDVLFCNDLRIQSRASIEEIDAVLDAILAPARLVQPIGSRLRSAQPDVGDEMALECAAAAGASAIAAMNTRDFEAVAAFGIDVLTPGAFFAKLKAMEA